VARRTSALAVCAAALACGSALAQPVPLAVCVAADNPPLSHLVAKQPRGLDVRIAQATASALGRPLKVVPFESAYEKESTLTHEVAALLAAGVCDAVSGFPLMAGEFGPPTRASSRTPDYPGAKRKRERPYVPLQAIAPSRGYISAALGVVLPPGAPPLASLNDLGERKLGAVVGTLGGAVAMGWKFGALRNRVVTLNQNESPLDEMAAPPTGTARRFDALLMPMALFDGWRVQHPAATLVAASWRRPLGMNLGFVTLASDATVRPALDAVIQQALADGSLARWAGEEGVTWSPPEAPDVGRGASLLQLVSE
jgi:ABC-type amino acid transport substrate-binding protein